MFRSLPRSLGSPGYVCPRLYKCFGQTTGTHGFVENSLRQVLRAVGFKEIDVRGNVAPVYSWRSYIRIALQRKPVFSSARDLQYRSWMEHLSADSFPYVDRSRDTKIRRASRSATLPVSQTGECESASAVSTRRDTPACSVHDAPNTVVR